LIDVKLEVLSKYFGMKLSIDRGPVTAFMLWVEYNGSAGCPQVKAEGGSGIQPDLVE
jgi:hypothetical protein